MNRAYIQLTEDEMQKVNGGGIAGAAAGYVIGVGVGAVAAISVGITSARSGDSRKMTGRAVLTTFTSSVITCTVVGACATGVF